MMPSCSVRFPKCQECDWVNECLARLEMLNSCTSSSPCLSSFYTITISFESWPWKSYVPPVSRTLNPFWFNEMSWLRRSIYSVRLVSCFRASTSKISQPEHRCCVCYSGFQENRRRLWMSGSCWEMTSSTQQHAPLVFSKKSPFQKHVCLLRLRGNCEKCDGFEECLSRMEVHI
jgi:hypothetical protein